MARVHPPPGELAVHSPETVGDYVILKEILNRFFDYTE